MCVITPTMMWAAASMAAGTALNAKLQADAAKRQKKAVRRAEDRQDNLLDKRRKNVLENLEQYAPEKRMQRQDQAADTAEAQLLDEVITAPRTDITPQGRVSTAYDEGQARRTAENMDRASRLASLMARYRAPSDLRFEEGMDNARYASEQDYLSSLGKSRAATDKTRIQRAGEINPWMQALGQALQTGGSAVLGGKLMGAGAAGGATSGAGLAGSSKPWWDITSGPRKIGLGG